LRIGFGEGDFALYGDEHGGSLRGGRRGGACRLRLESERDGLNAEDFAGEDGIAGGGIRNDLVFRFGEKFVMVANVSFCSMR